MANGTEAPDIQAQSPIPGMGATAPMLGTEDAAPANPAVPGQSQYGATTTGTDELPGMPDTGLNVDMTSALFIKHLLDRTPQPGAPAPGSFGDKLKRAFDQFGAGMGDAAAANRGAVLGEGPRGAIARVEEARSKRLLEESREAREAAEFRQRSALNNIQMAVHIQQLQKGSQERQDKVFEMNRAASSAREADGWHVEHNVSETEARHRIADFKDPANAGRHYTDLYEFIPVRYQEVNGKTVPIYDVVEKTARKVTPSRQEAEDIAAGGGPNLITKNSKGEEVITPVDNVALTSMRLAAQRRNDAVSQLEKSTGQKISEDNLRMGQKAFASKDVQDALQADPTNKVLALTQVSKDLQHKIKLEQAHISVLQTGQLPKDMTGLTPEDQKALSQFAQSAPKDQVQQAIQESQHYIDQYTKAMGNISDALQYGVSEQDRKDAETISRDRERESHDIELEKTQLMTAQAKQKEAEAAERRAIAAEKKGVTDTGDEVDPRAEGLEGASYLDFLKQARPDDYFTVNQILHGEKLPTRMSKEGLKVIKMVNRASGGEWSPAKAQDWPKNYDQFFGGGQEAKNIRAYNTLMQHIARYYKRTTGIDAFTPLTQQYNERQVEQKFIQEELGKAVSAGVMTQTDKADFENALFPTFQTAAKKRDRVVDAMKNLQARMDTEQNALEKVLPVKGMPIDPILDPTAEDAIDYVLSKGTKPYPAALEPGGASRTRPNVGPSAAPKTAPQAAPGGAPQAPPNAASEVWSGGQLWGWKLKDGSYKQAGSK